MKKIILVVVGVCFVLGCNSKPTNKMAEEAYKEKFSGRITNRIIQIIKFKTIGNPVTSVFDLDCQKLPCYKMDFEVEVRYLKTVKKEPKHMHQIFKPTIIKKGEIVKKTGNIKFKKTENGWENIVIQTDTF